MKTLQGKKALVTGAGSGIGREIAIRFAKEGAILGVADINMDAAAEVSLEIERKGGKAIPIHIDVSDEESVNLGFEYFKDVDILVSNAGIQHIERVDTLAFSDWKKMMSVHLDGAFLTSKAALKTMYAKKSGTIIFIGSVHSKEASVLKAPYVTAKHGLIGLCQVIAKEAAAYHVRANVICPGFVKTPLVEKQIPEQAKDLGISEDEVVKKIMLGQTVDGEFTSLEDIASACLFFASMPSNALTGQSLIVSHGWFME